MTQRIDDFASPQRGATQEALFCGKNNQTFASDEFAADTGGTPNSQSFCFFFQKEALSSFGPLASARAGTGPSAASQAKRKGRNR
jgi:hypothetical protein